MGAAPAPGVTRIAYLLNQYPAISHSFILREVQSLRRRGLEVSTFSIHRSDPGHLLADADREQDDLTYSLRPLAARSLLAAHATALRRHPLRYLRVLCMSVALARGSPRASLWQLFYFLEAVPLWLHIARARARHVHAHFTAPAADVALIVAALGDARGAWSWSFSAHGADISEADQRMLARKLRRAARVVCVSEFGAAQCRALAPDHADKLRVVRCGLDPGRFTPPVRRGQR
ncbi:MAG: glycosyltransferase, partial [Solirubrobacteraceae bacterium]